MLAASESSKPHRMGSNGSTRTRAVITMSVMLFRLECTTSSFPPLHEPDRDGIHSFSNSSFDLIHFSGLGAHGIEHGYRILKDKKIK